MNTNTNPWAPMLDATAYARTALGDFAEDYDLEAIAKELQDIVDANEGTADEIIDSAAWERLAWKHHHRWHLSVYDANESCGEVLVNEYHATYDEARARFDEICAEDGWRDGLEAAIFEVLDETTEVSVEAASL